jgi:hypothetical protein
MITVDKHCSLIPVGEGRLLNCLEKNDKQVSEHCEQALKDVIQNDTILSTVNQIHLFFR